MEKAFGPGIHEFRLLGPVEVWRRGRAVPLGGERQRALLALLLLNANEVVSSDRLIDELFGGRSPKTPANAVWAAVSRLRRALEDESGESVIITRPSGYLLRAAPEQVDVTRFEKLFEDGRRAFAAEDPSRAAVILREALALWRGPPLADLGSEEFAEQERRRLGELRFAAIVERIEAQLASGADAELVGELETLVRAYPLHQRLRAQFMLALYRSGREGEALQAYQDAREMLVGELGIEPGHELRRLQQAILKQDPDLDVVRRRNEDDSPHGVLVGQSAETRARRGRDRRHPVIYAVAGVALALGAALASLALVSGSARPVAVRANSLAVIDARRNRVSNDVPVGLQPQAVAFGNGAVWVGNVGDDSVSKLDPRSDTVTRTISVGATPGDITTSPAWVWVSLDESRQLAKIAPSDGAVEQRIPLPATGGMVISVIARTHDVFAKGAIWASEGFDLGGSPSDSDVFRVGLSSRRAIPVAHPATEIAGIASGYGSLWATGRSDNTLLELSPITGDVVATSTVGTSPGGIAVGDGAIWVASPLDDTVSKFVADVPGVAPTLKAVTHVGKDPVALAVGPGAVWAANSGDGSVSRIDPASGKVVRTIHIGKVPAGIIAHGNRVWVTVQAPAPF